MKKLTAAIIAIVIVAGAIQIANLKSDINELKLSIKFIEAKNKAQDDVDDKLIDLMKRYFDSIRESLERRETEL